MKKHLVALCALGLCLLTQQPHAQGPAGQAQIYFIDVGTGASTLIVSPTGKTLLVDGGPPGSGAKITSLLNTLGIATIDFTVLTHYHIDHMGGMIETMNAGRVGGFAFDNGDDPAVQPPGTSTSPASTRGTYLNYVAATGHGGITRQTAIPGTVLDLGGGMRATFMAAGGHLLSGGQVAITNADLNSESISTLIEYNDFDYLVSGDLTGGGSTSTAKTPDVETYVGQMVGDVDVVQLDHHGSTTANNQTFLSALNAEVAFAQTGQDNTFGHPNRETANKFLNTPDTAGATFPGTGVPPAGGDPAFTWNPVFYQNEASPAGDDRVTQQGYTGAAAGHAGQGTVRLATDGTTTYALSSFDDGGTRLNPSLHTYAVDGASPGLTADFKPTVVVDEAPIIPNANENVLLTAAVNDRESPISSVTLAYSLDGSPQAPVAMTFSSAVYQATIPGQPDGTRIDFTVTATAGTQTTAFSSGYFSGVTPIASLRALNALGEPRYTGYAARIQATVTASGYSAGTNDDYAQDASGAINVYRSTDTVTPFTSTRSGDVIEARGRVGFLGGRARFDLTESAEKTTTAFGITRLPGTVAPTPLATTFAALSVNTEAFEGQLVSIANVSRVSGNFPTTPQPLDAFVTVTDGTANFPLKIDHDTDIDGFVPGAVFNVVGIVQQDDFLRPFDAGYNVAPRSAVDLGATAPPPPPLLTIAEARVDAVTNADGNPPRDTIPDLLGHVVTVRGAVTSIDLRGGTGIEYYIQDPTGGIDLFSTSLSPSFAIGDNVEATGTITQFNGLTELTVTSVSFLGAGTAPPPQPITLSQLADGVGEALEGRLIRVDNVTVTAGGFGATGSSNNVTIADATGTGILRVDSDTDIDGTPTITGTFSLIGLASQFDTAVPFDSGYQIIPRSLADIIPSGPSCPAITINGSLPGGVVGAPYSQPLTASGGSAPYTFSAFTGSLPAGLTLSSDGVVSGTPTLAGTSTFTIRATTTDGCAGSASFTVTITGVLTVSPPSVDFGSVTTGSIGAASLTITNTSLDTVTLNTPFTITGTDASQFTAAAPTTTTLAAGAATTVTVTFLPTTTGPKSATLNVTSTGGGLAAIALSGTGAAPGGGGGGVVISEIRFRGPLGGNDEFVEIYNNSDSAASIGGWKLMGSSNTAPTGVRATVPANVTLPARTHYLFVNATAATGYSGAVPGNVGYTTGVADNGGVALTDAANNIIDQVGILTTGTGYREGNPIPTQLTTNVDRGYERKPGGLSVTLQDTGDNNADFQQTAPSNPQNIVIVPAPPGLDFGSLVAPGTLTESVTIRNLLLGPVTLNAPAISGSDAADFAAGAPGTITLASGVTTTVAVTFQPATTGHKSAMLTVTSTSAGTLAVPLAGNAITGIVVTPPSFDFGTVPPGSTTPTTLTIVNTDPINSVTLTPPFTITGTDAGSFTVGAPGTSFLGGSDTTPLPVSFHPLTPGPKSAALQVTSVEGGSRSIPLSGLAACPAISVAGAPPPGLVGVAYTTTFTASGGIAPYTFTLASGTVPTNVLLGGDGTLAGTPTAAGSFTFTVQAAGANGCTGAGTFTVPVTVPVITLTAAPASIAFGSIFAPASASQIVTLTNNTADPITVTTPLTITGSGASQFSVGAPASTTIAGSASTTVTVTFAPTSPGIKSATLNVVSSGGGSASVALSGSGASPVVISEFRFRGPAGGNDEFIEIFNNTSAAVDISGYTIHGSNNAGTNSTRATVPANVHLPALGHYLFVNTGAAGYSGTVPGNTSYTTGITDDGGVALFDKTNVILDQIGLSAGSAYKEGAVLASLGTTNADKSYARKPAAGGAMQDNDDNATDFVVATPSGPQDLVFNTTPASVTFDRTPTGNTRSTTVTIRNLLFAPVTITNAAIGGTDATSFDVGAAGSATIAVGESTTLPVSFHPASVATFTAQLTVTSDRGAVTIDLTGAGTPGIVVTPTAIDFGTVEPGTSVSADITIANDDALAIDVNPPTVTAGAPDFAVSTLDPLTLAPAASATATVAFNSTSPGAKSGTVTVSSVDGGTRTVTLNAVVACPAITVNAPLPPAEYGFAYSQVVTASGGTGPYAFAIAVGALPNGLALTSAGTLVGTPTALGAFPFTVQATTAHGCSGTANLTVRVNDTTPPVLTLPGNIAATATTPAGAVVSFSASAADLVDGAVVPACMPAAGAAFTIGATTVSCTATDAHGNAASGSFVVAVTAATVPGRMTGDARIDSGGLEHDVAFVVQERATGADAGAITYRARPRSNKDRGNRFESTAITTVNFFNVPAVAPGPRPASGVDTVSFSGVGRWNDRTGYTFDAVAVDAGEPGRGRDRFAITIRDAAGQVVAAVDSAIADGNIDSLPIE